MLNVVNLALPFFGLILLGFFCGRLMKLPESGLAWMNFYIVYVALPPLFFKLIAATPFHELQNWWFVICTTLATYLAFVLSLGIGLVVSGGNLRSATAQAVLGSYSNIGYMGPGLTLAAIGPQASVPTALIFVFDNILLFSLIPFLMALGSSGKLEVFKTMRLVIWRIVSHPFNIASFLAVLAAYFQVTLPVAVDKVVTYLFNSAAPVALFALGVTVASRKVNRVAPEVPIHLAIKLVLHPAIVLVLLSLVGGFSREWVYTAVLMAALSPALGVFVVARQYDVYVDEASSGVLIGTLASIVTVTALLYFLTTQSLPWSLFGR